MWNDLFNNLPLSENILQPLLFITFSLHILFVLLMIGTALIGFVSYIKEKIYDNTDADRLSGKVMGSHLAFKSLAVVLGVAPLLIIQVLYSEGFFTATGLFSYAWIGVIPLLIVAFLLIEAFEHKMAKGRLINIIFGVAGLGTLLTVPMIFTGALSLMERPSDWQAFASGELIRDADYLLHWIMRYLHIIGASIVVGGAFHLITTARKSSEKNKAVSRWVTAGILIQVMVGIPLMLTIASKLSVEMIIALTIGIIAAMTAMMILFFSANRSEKGLTRPLPIVLFVAIALVSMLSARQIHQDNILIDIRKDAQKEISERSEKLSKYKNAALMQYQRKLETLYDNGKTIYDKSCMPCHGMEGKGDGYAANRLLVKAEDLSAMQGERKYIRGILLNGRKGSAMPYFKVFDKDKIDSLLDEMDTRFQTFAEVEAPSDEPSADANIVWNRECSTCHGANGEPTDFGRGLSPMPPDFRKLHLDRDRAMQIITEGYPGTVMQPFRNLSEEIRSDLVTILDGFYTSNN